MFAISIFAAGCGGSDVPPVDPAAGGTPAPGTDPNAAAVGNDPNAMGATDPNAPVDPNALGATAAPDATGEDVPGANEITNADAKAGQLVSISARTPKKFSDAHCSKPILVVLYQPDSILDSELYASAKAAAKAAGVKDLVTLAYSPRDVKKMGDLPSKLGLLATPGVATVGRDGQIENFWTTYVDDALIRRSIENAAAAKPCKVSSGDVPAAGSALADATVVANGGTVTETTSNPLAGTEPGTPAVDAAADPAAINTF